VSQLSNAKRGKLYAAQRNIRDRDMKAENVKGKISMHICMPLRLVNQEFLTYGRNDKSYKVDT